MSKKAKTPKIKVAPKTKREPKRKMSTLPKAVKRAAETKRAQDMRLAGVVASLESVGVTGDAEIAAIARQLSTTGKVRAIKKTVVAERKKAIADFNKMLDSLRDDVAAPQPEAKDETPPSGCCGGCGAVCPAPDQAAGQEGQDGQKFDVNFAVVSFDELESLLKGLLFPVGHANG